jgi:peroxiredoxin
MRLLACLLAAQFAFTLIAWAESPNVGDRAKDFYGRDIVSQQVVHLEDYAGQWVLVDFWSGWCGPCMEELPNLLAQTTDLRANGSLAIVSVSLDDWETLPRLRKAIKWHGIKYPVLFDGGFWETVIAQEWDIRAIPATFLIDPQGVVVATSLRGEFLRPALDFLMNYPGGFTPIGARLSGVVQDDGSVATFVELDSPKREVIWVELDYTYICFTYAEDDPNHERRWIKREIIQPDENNPEATWSVAFEDASERVIAYTIPAVENVSRIICAMKVRLPGTEALVDGQGIWVASRKVFELEKH